MKKINLLYTLAIAFFFSSCDVQSQTQLNKILSQTSNYSNPTNTEITTALKQALEIGVATGSDRLSVKDGFLGNTAVKILFPPEAKKVESTLRNIGLGSLADNVITTVNRAAEAAVVEAKPIFVSAIKQMTIADATNILLGNRDAATLYFKRVTTAQLIQKFKPIVEINLNKVGATKYWGDVTTKYNLISKTPINTDLSAYVTDKAIDGLFLEVAKEELNIRNNLTARSSTLLQKVFGYADKKK